MPKAQSTPSATMTGPLKRKFDQLDEDSSSLCSSSSSLSSGRRSGSCSPSSSVSLAWDSDEEGPWDQIPLPDRDFCGPRSFTRESPPAPPPGNHHTPSSFLKTKLGGPPCPPTEPFWPLEVMSPRLWLPTLSTSRNTVVTQECLLSRGTGPARFTFDLGTPCLEVLPGRTELLTVALGPSGCSSSLLFQFHFSSLHTLSYLRNHRSPTPHTSAPRGLSGRSLSCQNAVWLCLNIVERFLSSSYFSSWHNFDFKLTKTALK